MADPKTCLPIAPESVRKAHEIIRPHIHRTPLVTSATLNRLASTPSHPGAPAPTFRLFFKCENYQKIGAFKARGAFHAIKHLIKELGLEETKRRGVVTHSSGNHAQALALAASTFLIPAYIVMPTISTPSKIAGTQHYTDHVIFSGSTSEEREAKVAEVIEETGAILVPPYDHPDIILGQGTTALELHEQYNELLADEPALSQRQESQAPNDKASLDSGSRTNHGTPMADGLSTLARYTLGSDAKGPLPPQLDAVIAPLGGGGLLSGVATYFSQPFNGRAKKTLVFGAEPSFQGGDDARRGLAAGKRIESVKTLTIADGLRTPLGLINWGIISDKNKVEGVYAVSEDQIKSAMKLVLERMKVFVEPSACVGLAVVLYDEGFREMVETKQREEEEGGEGRRPWDVGVVFSGGNTTVEAIAGLFAAGGKGKEGDGGDEKTEREEGKVGINGEKVAENVAG